MMSDSDREKVVHPVLCLGFTYARLTAATAAAPALWPAAGPTSFNTSSSAHDIHMSYIYFFPSARAHRFVFFCFAPESEAICHRQMASAPDNFFVYDSFTALVMIMVSVNWRGCN